MDSIVFLGQNQEPIKAKYIATSGGIMKLKVEEEKITNYIGQVVHRSNNPFRMGIVAERGDTPKHWKVAWDLRMRGDDPNVESVPEEELSIQDTSRNIPTKERAPRGRMVLNQGRRGDRIRVADGGTRRVVHAIAGTIWHSYRDQQTRYKILWDTGEFETLDTLDHLYSIYFDDSVVSVTEEFGNLPLAVPVTLFEEGLYVTRECEPTRVGRMVSFVVADQKAKVVWDIEFGDSYSWEKLEDLLHAEKFSEVLQVFDYVEFFNPEKDQKEFGTIFGIRQRYYDVWLNSCRAVAIPKGTALIRAVSASFPTWVYGQMVGRKTRRFDRVTGQIDSGQYGRRGTVVSLRDDLHLEVHFDGDTFTTWIQLEAGKVQLVHTPEYFQALAASNPRLYGNGQMISNPPHIGTYVVQISTGLKGTVLGPDENPYRKASRVKWTWNPRLVESVPWTDLMHHVAAPKPPSVQRVALESVEESRIYFCMVYDLSRRKAYLITITDDLYVRIVSHEGAVFVGKFENTDPAVRQHARAEDPKKENFITAADIQKQLEEVGYAEEHAVAKTCSLRVKHSEVETILCARGI
jgi:hypothetical protein